LIDYLHEWSADGKHSVIGVFHDVNLALRLTDNVLFMHEGRIVVDVAGEEKKKLTRADLLGLFEQAAGQQLSSDRLLLS